MGDVIRKRAEAAGVVALRRLDLDDFSAEVREEAGAIRPGDSLREIDDTSACEGGIR